MSLFRKVGKTFEKTKRSVVGTDEAAYVCRTCERPVEKDHAYCPHCGEPTVEPAE